MNQRVCPLIPFSFHADVISLLVGTASKSRKVESRHIKDYFSSCPVTLPLSVESQTDMTLSSIADLEGRTQNESLVSSLQSRVSELERFLTVCKEKLETTTIRLNKCLAVGKELLIEKVFIELVLRVSI